VVKVITQVQEVLHREMLMQIQVMAAAEHKLQILQEMDGTVVPALL
jgi:hypothetical protein